MADDAVVTIDTGAHTVFTARHWQTRKGQQLAVCGNLASMATAVLYKLPVKVILFKNNLLAMDRFEQEEAGYPDALQPIDFAAIAVACGAEGYTVTSPGAPEPTLRKALRSDRPAVVQVEVDPDEVPAAPEKLRI
jgi:pyruvate dehydrogenase (quinone)/pyruvate oxidase/pyruvate decarboxylase